MTMTVIVPKDGEDRLGKRHRTCRDWLWSMPAAVISVLVAFFVGSSWYLAGKIRSEALTVGPGPSMPAYDDVQFVGLSPGEVRLRAIGEQPALFKPELYGI